MKSNKEHYITKVNFYDSINDSMLKFAVIIARHNGKWVFCKHKERNEYYGAAEPPVRCGESHLSGRDRFKFCVNVKN